MGVTSQWIEVESKTGTWKLRAEVIGFKSISGDHSGENLGCYFIGLCEHVGIIQPKLLKVSHLTLIKIS